QVDAETQAYLDGVSGILASIQELQEEMAAVNGGFDADPRTVQYSEAVDRLTALAENANGVVTELDALTPPPALSTNHETIRTAPSRRGRRGAGGPPVRRRRHPPAGSRERLRPSRLRSRDSHRERPLRRRPGRTEHHRTRRRDPGHDRGRRGRLMGVTVGPVGEDRAAEYLAAMGQAFGFDSSDEHRERFSKYFEWDRARAAYDGDRIVGTLGAYSFEMTVPGGTMPCGGTTVVAVLPTH